MPKYYSLPDAAYLGTTQDITDTFLSNARADNFYCINVSEKHRKNSNNQEIIYPFNMELYLNPTQAAVFSRQKENLALVLENIDENNLWDCVNNKHTPQDHSFGIAKKLGLDEFTFMLIIRAISFLDPKIQNEHHFEDLSKIIISGIKDRIFSDEQIGTISKSLQGPQRVFVFMNLMETNLISPIKIFLNNGCSVDFNYRNDKCALEVALLLDNVDVNIIRLFFDLNVDSERKNPKTNRQPIDLCRTPLMRKLFVDLETLMKERKAAKQEAERAKQEAERAKQDEERARQEELHRQEVQTAREVIPEDEIATGNTCCSCLAFLWSSRRHNIPKATIVEQQTAVNQDSQRVRAIVNT